MEILFAVVAAAMWIIAEVFGISYEAANVVVYFYVIPLAYLVLLDKIIKRHFSKVLFLAFLLISVLTIPDFELFSDKLFASSVDFLLWFNHFGLDYVQASVIICVFVPRAVFVCLLYLACKTKFHTNPITN